MTTGIVLALLVLLSPVLLLAGAYYVVALCAFYRALFELLARKRAPQVLRTHGGRQ